MNELYTTLSIFLFAGVVAGGFVLWGRLFPAKTEAQLQREYDLQNRNPYYDWDELEKIFNPSKKQ